MVQHLVEDTTSTSAIMPTVTLNHTQTLVMAATTQCKVEYRTGEQSWLGLTSSHLMRWRCFISAESRDIETRQLLNLTNCSRIIYLFSAEVVDKNFFFFIN